MFVMIRIILGVLFIISGGEKVLSPMENFLYVIDGYKVIPTGFEPAVALVFPWVELLVGVFILLGLWLRQAFVVLFLMSVSLAGIVSQAIVRQLPLDSCGCFGELIHIPLRGVLLVDLSVIVLTLLCLANIKRTSLFSIDGLYARAGS